MGQEEENSGESKWATLVQSQLARLPAEYAQRYAAASEMRHAFQSKLAESLQESLNEHLKTVPQDTLIEKQALASWVNEQLRLQGLAIRCPKTGLPAILVADFKDAQSEDISRFRLEVRDPRRGRYKSFSSGGLFEFTLIEDLPRQESMSRRYRSQRDDQRGK